MHKSNITSYGNQIYSMYTRNDIIGFYEKRKEACQERINYSKNNLETDPENKVSKIALNDSLKELKEIDFALGLLNGTDLDLLHSYINVSEIGKKIS